MATGAGCGSCYVVDTASPLGIESTEGTDLSSHDNETPHLPPPSLWPIGFAIGVACLLVGLVVSTLVAVVGAVIAALFAFLWIRDVTAPVRTPPATADTEAAPVVATAAPARAVSDDELETYPRSTFLSLATLGLGGVIGAAITLPVLGFAVLPSFTNQDEQDVTLGPIENFPEGEFVIATYLENREVGEVTRRTMFVRNNGLLEGEPSFTLLYSRCAHLGCPVQPNGPIEEDKKKTVGNVELRPVLAVGFGCPCHGGQYDTEGNRTAGPPVRALDRAEYSIKDGELVLGSFYSVSEVS
jgi:Rieske Fe-S protein